MWWKSGTPLLRIHVCWCIWRPGLCDPGGHFQKGHKKQKLNGLIFGFIVTGFISGLDLLLNWAYMGLYFYILFLWSFFESREDQHQECRVRKWCTDQRVDVFYPLFFRFCSAVGSYSLGRLRLRHGRFSTAGYQSEAYRNTVAVPRHWSSHSLDSHGGDSVSRISRGNKQYSPFAVGEVALWYSPDWSDHGCSNHWQVSDRYIGKL